MKKDLLLAGVLVGLAALGIGVVVVIQALQPEDDHGKTIKPNPELIAHVVKKEEKKTPAAPTPKRSEPKQEQKKAPKIEEPVRKNEEMAPKTKIEAKAEPKKEIKAEPKKEVKAEPKAEVKIEPKKDDKKPAAAKVIVFGNDIKLNDPDGAYALKPINGGDKYVVQGKIKTLTIAEINDKSSLDATLLEASEIIFTGNLNSGASVLLGKAHTLKVRDINDKSTLDASALDARHRAHRRRQQRLDCQAARAQGERRNPRRDQWLPARDRRARRQDSLQEPQRFGRQRRSAPGHHRQGCGSARRGQRRENAA